MTDDSALVLANYLDALERRTLTLDEVAARHSDQLSMLMELASLAQQLRLAPAVTPSLDFRVDARRRLEARLPARRRSNSLLVNWPRVPAAHRLIIARVLVALVVLIALGSSVVAASAQSLPNDSLYPIKIAIEQVRMALSPDRLARSELGLSFASERLSEVQRLIERGRGDEAAGALTGFAEQIQSAATLAAELPAGHERELLLSRLQSSFDRSNMILVETEPQLPQSVQPALKRAREVLHLPPVVNPPGIAPGPTATPTSTPTLTSIPTREKPTRPVIMTIVTATKVPPTRPTLPPAYLPTLRPALVPTRWQTVVPTRWLTAMPTLGPAVIATLRSTIRPTLAPPTLSTRPPIATLGSWPTPNPTLLPMPIRTLIPAQTPFRPR